jgi:GNAT superfamily N-acetyltransferase
LSIYRCEPLAESHSRESFCCGAAGLDNYLRTQARQDVDRKVAAVFVMVEAEHPRTIIGYYTLSALGVEPGDLTQEVAKKLPRYPLLPAFLIGRLARDLQHRGAGSLLLADALGRCLRQTSEIGAAAVLVDAKDENAEKFYQRHGFILMRKTPRRLFLPMKTISRGCAERRVS